jgi:hypothetical protein
MLPLPLASLAAGYLVLVLAPVYTVIDVGIPVNVNIDVTVSPIAVSPRIAPRRPYGKAHSERDHRYARHVPRRVVIIGGIGRIPPGSIDHRRIVGRYVDNLRILRLDDDGLRLLLHRDLLPFGALQVAFPISLKAQLLDRVHHVFLLCKKGITQLLHPVQLLIHHIEHLGEIH